MEESSAMNRRQQAASNHATGNDLQAVQRRTAERDMSEHHEHNPTDHEDPLSGPTWLLGVIGVVLTIVIVLGLTALYYNAQAQFTQERVMTAEIRELREHRQRQQARLEGPPRWETREFVGEEQDVYIVPIEDAMHRVVEKYGR